MADLSKKQIVLNNLDAILARLNAQEPRAVVAADYGMSTTTLTTYLLQQHIPLPDRRTIKGKAHPGSPKGFAADLIASQLLAIHAKEEEAKEVVIFECQGCGNDLPSLDVRCPKCMGTSEIKEVRRLKVKDEA